VQKRIDAIVAVVGFLRAVIDAGDDMSAHYQLGPFPAPHRTLIAVLRRVYADRELVAAVVPRSRAR
jgi:hypothetical protein